MTNSKYVKTSEPTANVQFFSIRNISNPDDNKSGRKVHVAQVSIDQIVGVNTDENVRNYTGESRKTEVHRKILETLQSGSERFSVLNGGIVIVTDEATIDDKTQTVTLRCPSIINGAQTQGVIKDYIEALKKDNLPIPKIYVKVEIIETSNEELRREITIARNLQNKVQMLSIYGVQGVYEDLAQSIAKGLKPKYILQVSEDQTGDEYIPVDKLVQVLAALTPMSLGIPDQDEKVNRSFCYSSKAKCLRLYQNIWTAADDPKEDAQYRTLCKKVYECYQAIAPTAWMLYRRWQSHPAFKQYIRPDGEKGDGFDRSHVCEKKGDGLQVSDGILFPILTALSNYVVPVNGTWMIEIPDGVEEGLVEAAMFAYNTFSDSNPQTMGKSGPVYAYINKHHKR
jgi:hypothetical protein